MRGRCHRVDARLQAGAPRRHGVGLRRVGKHRDVDVAHTVGLEARVVGILGHTGAGDRSSESPVDERIAAVEILQLLDSQNVVVGGIGVAVIPDHLVGHSRVGDDGIRIPRRRYEWAIAVLGVLPRPVNLLTAQRSLACPPHLQIDIDIDVCVGSALDVYHGVVLVDPDPQVHADIAGRAGYLDLTVTQPQPLRERRPRRERIRIQRNPDPPELQQAAHPVVGIPGPDIEHQVAVAAVLDPHIQADVPVPDRHRTPRVGARRIPHDIQSIQIAGGRIIRVTDSNHCLTNGTSFIPVWQCRERQLHSLARLEMDVVALSRERNRLRIVADAEYN